MTDFRIEDKIEKEVIPRLEKIQKSLDKIDDLNDESKSQVLQKSIIELREAGDAFLRYFKELNINRMERFREKLDEAIRNNDFKDIDSELILQFLHNRRFDIKAGKNRIVIDIHEEKKGNQ